MDPYLAFNEYHLHFLKLFCSDINKSYFLNSTYQTGPPLCRGSSPRNCWRQLSYAIKNQRRAMWVFCSKVGGFGCTSWHFMAYGSHIIGPFRAWKQPILMP